ncbi:uncharacterized protein FOMMEDRAFT_74077, partial [Fomitiporia mediterranea MF3/22]|uniref:uncharacterized protein n=1 Tax=Fomitiporia mediterranea (strain MF3/22) TaxID=694068 RepID=UPI0004408A08
KSDKAYLKLHVLLIWILCTVYLILLLKTLYVYFVKEFGNLQGVGTQQRVLNADSMLAATIDAMVQAVFANRIWHLSKKNLLLTGAICASILAQFALTATFFGTIHDFTTITQFLTVRGIESATCVVAVFTDSFIAVTMIYLLRHMQSGFRRTESVINRLITYVVSSSLITSLSALLALIFLEALPQTLAYLFFNLIIPKRESVI